MARGNFSTTNYLLYGGGIITQPLTIAAWVNPSSITANQAITGIYYTGAGSGSVLDGWYLRITSAGLVDGRVGDGSGETPATSASAVTAGVWSHAAFKVISATSRYAYLNGVAGSQSTTSRIPTTPDKTAIGVLIRQSGSLGAGATAMYIAELGFWNVALSDAEIAILANGISPLCVRPGSLVAYYPLVRGDSSGDEPNPKNAALKMVEQGTINVQTHPRIFYPTPRRIIKFASDGTAYNQSASGGLTPAGMLTRDASKLASGTVTPAGTANKSTTKSFDGTQSTSGAVNKTTVKSPVGAVTSDGALTSTAGKSPYGALTSAGATNKESAKSPSGNLASTGNLTKTTFKSSTGSLASDGVLARAITFVKDLGGTLSSAGALARAITFSKDISGTLTSSGTLAVAITFVKNLGGTLSSAGTILKQAAKTPSGNLTSSGDVSKTTNKPVTGTLTPTGALALILAFTKAVGGALTPAGNVLKQIAKTFSGGIASSGDTTKESAKLPSSSLPSAGGLSIAVQKNTDGQTQPSGSVSRLTSKILLANLLPSGVLSSVKIPGVGTVYNQSASGSTTPSGNLSTLFAPGIPAAVGEGAESWGGAFRDDINPRPRKQTTLDSLSDDDDEAIIAFLLWKMKN